MEQPNQRHSQRERVIDFNNDDDDDDDDGDDDDDDEYFHNTAEEKELSTQFLQMQKNQLIDLQHHLERCCNTLAVFGFNSAKYDIKLIKSYLLPIFVNER